MTSPPYWGLRDYGNKGEIGDEESISEYVGSLVEVFEAVRPVLRDDGTVWLNLGDAYGPNKQLLGMPWRVALALQQSGWILRADVIWHKPNPMPESVTDRPTKSHEYLFLLVKGSRYHYDPHGYREPPRATTGGRVYGGRYKGAALRATGLRVRGREMSDGDYARFALQGANLRDVWTIVPKGFRGAHFAVFPEALVERCLRLTGGRGACPTCGSPYRAAVSRERVPTRPGKVTKVDSVSNPTGKVVGNRDRRRHITKTTLTGYEARCGCNDTNAPVPSVVLDPFMGSGTTGVVAKRMGLSFVGIDLNPEYVKLAERRIANGPGAKKGKQ